jgi:hypothetical protein
MQHEIAAVGDMPVNELPFLEIHGLGERGREVDVPLVGPLGPLDLLHLGGIPHDKPSCVLVFRLGQRARKINPIVQGNLTMI